MELIVHTTNVTLFGVLPGETYYIEISFNGEQSSIFYIKGLQMLTFNTCSNNLLCR